MATTTKKYKIFIASPFDVTEEPEIISDFIGYWNSINSDYYGAILETVSGKKDAIPEISEKGERGTGHYK